MTRMTAHKRKEWYIVAKNKRLTNKEKQARAELKKRMQDKGVLPPDKPKLNRKKFIDEAREEWNGRSSDCFIWEHYLMDAISYMLCQREGMSSRASLEAVGAAKVLKLAIRLREFSEEVREKGEHEYKLVDQYNYIKDIFLLCTNRFLKPFIYQLRKKIKFTSLTRDTDENVFMLDEYLYGADGRSNAGYGFWQMAYGSTGEVEAQAQG